jgi:hypothetical protein
MKILNGNKIPDKVNSDSFENDGEKNILIHRTGVASRQCFKSSDDERFLKI